MAGDKDIQTQDQTYQVQGYCAVVDDYLGDNYYIVLFSLINTTL